MAGVKKQTGTPYVGLAEQAAESCICGSTEAGVHNYCCPILVKKVADGFTDPGYQNFVHRQMVARGLPCPTPAEQAYDYAFRHQAGTPLADHFRLVAIEVSRRPGAHERHLPPAGLNDALAAIAVLEGVRSHDDP